MSAVAGYCLSQRRVRARLPDRARGGQWTKGKGCETFGPIGPWFVTKDEIKDPQNLDMWLDVNGEKRQRGNTKTMIFGVAHLVWACSQYLHPGAGRHHHHRHAARRRARHEARPKFLKAGDVVTLGIDGPRRAEAEGREGQILAQRKTPGSRPGLIVSNSCAA